MEHLIQSPAWEYYKKFLSWDIQKQNQELINKPAQFWQDMGEQKALEVFHAASVHVPAYKKFLQTHKIDHKKIKTIEDFKKVPPVDKNNYLRLYPLHELCWDGNLKRKNVISVSSGSTGKPFFWPRDIWQEHEVDHMYALALHTLFDCDTKHSLIIIAFAMGMYIAGPFTYASCLRLAQKEYPISIATPSNDINAVLRVAEELSPEFEQIIIGGYPPLIKDIVDSGAREGIDWKAKNTKLFFGGEGFSEQWRDYVHSILGSTAPLSTTLNMYGTADAALLGIETPTSILLRRTMSKDKQRLMSTFNNERLPSIQTYNPLLKYFETLEDESLVFTSSSAIPLIRYKIGDIGGTIPHEQIDSTLQENGVSLSETLNQENLSKADWKLPVVYLFGRKDFTVQLYGANIYPENIKEALEDTKINQLLSGKFVLTTDFSKTMTPSLKLRVELAPKVKPDAAIISLVKKTVTETLIKKNAEYKDVYSRIKKKAEPKIKLEMYGHKDFKINIKHSWVNKLKI